MTELVEVPGSSLWSKRVKGSQDLNKQTRLQTSGVIGNSDHNLYLVWHFLIRENLREWVKFKVRWRIMGQ